MTGAEPFIDGVPLSSICKFHSLKWTTRWPYGDWEASCKVSVPVDFRHPALVTDKDVEIKWGGGPMWLGDLAEPDWGNGELYFRGRIRQGENYQAWQIVRVGVGTDDFLYPALNIETAIDLAIAGGPVDGTVENVTSTNGVVARDALQWKRDSLIATDLWDTYPDEPAWIFPDMVDLAATRAGLVPHMNQYGRLQFLGHPISPTSIFATPPTPTWQIHPDVVDIAEAGGDSRVTRVALLFLDSTDADEESIHFSSDTRFKPYREQMVDTRSLGPMTPTEAATIADAILAESLRPVFATDITLTPFTATTWFGNPANPLTARARQVVRVHGATHPRLGGSYIDIVAGEVTVSDAETDHPTALIKPENKPPRTEEEVMKQALADARKALAA